MKKTGILLLLLLLSPVIAGLYGIINDQLSFSISPEYYTKFKFYQFGLVKEWGDYIFQNPRKGALIVGWNASWWMGPPIAFILGLVALIYPQASQVFKTALRSMALAILVTFVTGMIGLTYGYFWLAEEGVSWRLPYNLIETRNYIAVGSMHNFSYAGGGIGLLLGIAYTIVSKRRKETLKA